MKRYLRGWSTTSILVLVAIVAVATAGVTALLVNIFERKSEATQTFVRLAEVTEDTTCLLYTSDAADDDTIVLYWGGAG